MTSAVHPNGRAGTVAKVAAFLCFAIAAGLMIGSMVTSPARATLSEAAQKSASAAHPSVHLR